MNTDTFVKLLENSGFHNVSQDSAYVYMEDPSCVLRGFETFSEYAWIVIVCMAALLLTGWGISMIRGAKNDIFTNMRNLLLIFAILGASKPIMNAIYGDDLFARGCDTITVPIAEVNKMLAAREAHLSSPNNDYFYEDFDIYDSGAAAESPSDDFDDAPSNPADNSMHPTSAKADNRNVLYSYPNGITVRRTGGSRAWRNNNPGNIVYGEFARSAGAIGYAGNIGNGHFAVFPDQDTGMNAVRRLLRTEKYQRQTVAGAISTWCPDSSSRAYRQMVNQITGIGLNTPMSQLNDAQIEAIAQAIYTVEGWTVGTEQRV